MNWSPTAKRSLQRLPESVATAVIEFAYGALRHDPARIGKPLQGELLGLWAARRGDYRVIYRFSDVTLDIAVIAHRRDAYRTR
ncbi:MAG: type II toxin-antitoxin system RelE family toxin [Actinomycetota bacterium]